MKCLKCEHEMRVVTVVGCDGLQIDVCDEHGSWLDTGELKKILGVDGQKGTLKRRVVKKKINKLASQIFDEEYKVKENRANQLKDA